MKKLYVLGLTMILVLAMATVVCAETKVTFGGEGNFGYKFIDGDGNDEDFNNYKLVVTAQVDPNVTLLAKMKCDPAAGNNKDPKGNDRFFADEYTATIALDSMKLQVGYFGFGFGGNKDLLDAASADFKSKAALQVEMPLAEGLTGKLFYASKDNGLDAAINDSAYGLRVDYSLNNFGAGFIYGDMNYGGKALANGVVIDKSNAYTLTASYKVMPDLKAYVDYSYRVWDIKATSDKEDNKNIILGVYYTSDKSPWEFRAEYDLDKKNKIAAWGEDLNPWQIRGIYKFSPNLKVQVDGYQKEPGDGKRTIESKLCVTF